MDRRDFADDQCREYQSCPEDLDRYQPVSGEPVSEEGGKDGLHREDHRRTGREDALLNADPHTEDIEQALEKV